MDETTEARAQSADNDGAQILRPTPAFVQAALERARASAEKRRKHDWCTLLERNERGDARPTSANALIALQNAEELEGIVAIDEMKGAPIMLRSLPGMEESSGSYPRRLADNDLTNILIWMQTNGLPTMGYDAAARAVATHAEQSRFHPIRTWLDGLEWDGEKRLDTLMSLYFRSEDTLYTRDVGRRFIIAMIARIMNPGCKMDYMLILEGEQGVRKSTACNVLGGEWFSDSLPDLRHGGKDVSQHIRGKWLIEVAEMSALDKSDANALKSFLTRRVEKYRPSYGRFDIEEPRQCVFVGTTNQATYLRDETGARRMWPVKVGVYGNIDIDALSQDREQIFAEAVSAFREGEKYWPDAEIERGIYAQEQAARYEADEWEPVVTSWLMDKQHDQIRLLDITEYALNISPKDVGTTQSRRLAAILRRNGWRQYKTKSHNRWVFSA